MDNEGKNSSAFGALLDRMERNKDKYYLFVAIRPSGFGNFMFLKDAVRKRGINLGYEPVDQNRPLSVSESR